MRLVKRVTRQATPTLFSHAAADLYVSTFVKGIIEQSINNLAAGAVAAA